jgi:acylglycerol lipase
VLVVHGFAEHSGRYDHVGRALAEKGLAVHALDCRGHGKSGGKRVHVDSVQEYVADVQAARQEVHRRHPGAPLFLLGHSQGGLVVLVLALRSPEGIAGLVLCSPFLAVHADSRPSPVVRALAAVLERAAPSLTVRTHIDARLLARDPAVVEAYRRDPMVSHAASAGWQRAVRRAQREARRDAHGLRVPALVMASGGDRLTDPEATRALAAAAPVDKVTFVRWEDAAHEMLNDLGKEHVLDRIVDWIEARQAAGGGRDR